MEAEGYEFGKAVWRVSKFEDKDWLELKVYPKEHNMLILSEGYEESSH